MYKIRKIKLKNIVVNNFMIFLIRYKMILVIGMTIITIIAIWFQIVCLNKRSVKRVSLMI